MNLLQRATLAALIALFVSMLVIALASSEPLRALQALYLGALPELHWSADKGLELRRLARFGVVIEDTVTLTLLGLAVLCGFRARQFSMGADGQLFLSALMATCISVQLASWGLWSLPAAALAAVAVGFAWGYLPGLLKARFDANEIVTTLMLNLIALQIYRYVITYVFNDATVGFVATPLIPEQAALAPIMARSHVTVLVLLVPLAAFFAWWLMERTTVGYEISTVGDSPAFARQAGIPVARAIALSMAIGGAFAGLAGLHMSNALLRRMPVDLNPGLGFEGLMIALLARNDPRWVPVAAFLYAYIKAGGQVMERTTDVSRELVLVIQAVVVLFVVSRHLVPTASAKAAP
ncbi:MAG: ABC transporter permease [Pseudomonadota bacterium]